MRWNDRAFILHVSPLNERDVTLELLTATHGRLRTVAKFGATSKQRALYQVGNLVTVQWEARLATHMGHIVAECERCYLPLIMNDPPRLLMLHSAHALCSRFLYEHDAADVIFNALCVCYDHISTDVLTEAAKYYALFEQILLTVCGYGLDLSTCAATGKTEDLAYISPKSGRAVSREAGLPYHDKLFAMPAFFGDIEYHPTMEEVVKALALNGHFMQRRLCDDMNIILPPVRHRLEEALHKVNTLSLLKA